MTLSLEPHYIKLVKEITGKHLPGQEVLVFGSRTTGLHKPHSDLDLCVKGSEPMSLKQLADVREAFTESDLPMRVDIVDWATITPDFKLIIQKTALTL